MISDECPLLASKCRSWVQVSDAVVTGPAMMVS
jgi:hypothetical protein